MRLSVTGKKPTYGLATREGRRRGYAYALTASGEARYWDGLLGRTSARMASREERADA